MNSKSSQNYDPQRHYGLTDEVFTMPGAWDLSSMPVAKKMNDSPTMPAQPKIHYPQSVEQPRLLWLMDPFYEWDLARCYPYFSPY